MADITKMFVHYNGTREAFATAGLETKYTNSIVFITGDTTGESCIYTHGRYFANAQELVNDLKDALEYVKGVKVGDKTYTIPAGGGYIPFAATDPETVALNVSNGTLTFGLTDAFVGKVNATANSLGTSSDAEGTTTAWAYIKKLESLINALEGKDSSTDKAIADLDASVKAAFTKNDNQDSSIAALDASMKAAFAKDASQDASIDALVKKDASLDADIAALDASMKAAFTKNANQDTSIGNLDASMQAAFAKDASQDASIAALAGSVESLVKKDASLDADIATINGKLDASIAVATSAEGTNNGVKVSVTTQKGKVTAVAVDASGVVTKSDLAALKATKDDTDNGVKVSVTTDGGVVTAVAVDASAIAGRVDDLEAAMPGKADLDESGKILAEQLPDYILGQVLYGGTIDASGKITPSTNFTNKYGSVSTLPAISGSNKYEGAYFIATAAGTAQGVEYNTGDWVISNGSAWVIVDNTDAVASVAGLTGTITASALAKKLAETGDANELALKSELDGALLDASTLKGRVDGHDASIEALAKKDASLDSEIATIKSDASTLKGRVDGHDTSIANLDASMQAVFTKDASQDASIEALSKKDASLDADIKAINDKLDASIASAVSAEDTDRGVKVTVTTQKGKVTAVAVDASGVVTTGELAALKATKSGNDGGVQVSVTTDGGVVTAVAVDASALENEIAGIKSDASTLKGRVDGHDTSINNINTSIENINKKDASQDASIADLYTMLTWEEL